MIPFNWLLLGLLGLLAFRSNDPKPTTPAAAPTADPMLDAGMDQATHAAVFNCYRRCQDPGYLRAFAAELHKAGFIQAAHLLSIRANQLQPPTPAPQAAPPQPAAAPKPTPEVIPEAVLRAIESLSPEQRAQWAQSLTDEQRAQVDRIMAERPARPKPQPAPPPQPEAQAAPKTPAALPAPKPDLREANSVPAPQAVPIDRTTTRAEG